MRAPSAFETVHIVAGICLNVLLLYLIRNHSRVQLGVYKQLLTIFTSFDIFLVILHSVIGPKVLIVGRTFGAVADTFTESRAVSTAFSSAFTIPFFLLNIHFLYRYWSVRRPEWIELFSRPIFISAVIFGSICGVSAWYLVSYFGCSGTELDAGTEAVFDAYEREYGKRIESGWLVMDHFRDSHQDPWLTLTLVVFDIMIIGSFTLALSLGTLTYAAIRAAQTMSAKTKTLQLKLLFAVTAQTIVPLIFVYIPYFIDLNLPYLDVDDGGLGDYSMQMTSCFLAWDAVIIISLMADYREAALKMTPLTRWMINSSSSTVNVQASMMTTMVRNEE